MASNPKWDNKGFFSKNLKATGRQPGFGGKVQMSIELLHQLLEAAETAGSASLEISGWASDNKPGVINLTVKLEGDRGGQAQGPAAAPPTQRAYAPRARPNQEAGEAREMDRRYDESVARRIDPTKPFTNRGNDRLAPQDGSFTDDDDGSPPW